MKELKTGQICAFFVAFLPVVKYYTTFSYIAVQSGEDLWLSLLFYFAVDFLIFTAFYFLCNNKSFYDTMADAYGKTFTRILMFLLAVVFLIKAFLPIAEQKNFVELSLYDASPSVVTFIPFFIAAFFLCMAKVRVIGRCAELLWFLTIFAMVLIIALSFSHCEFSAILPIGAHPFKKIFNGAYSVSPWGFDSAYFLIFAGRFTKPKKSYLFLSLAYLIGVALTVVYAIVFYATFINVAKTEFFVLTEVSKFSGVISTTARFDYIGIFIIMFNTIFALIVPLWMSVYCLEKAIRFKKKFIPVLIVIGITFVAIYALHEKLETVKSLYLKYAGLIYGIFFAVIPILLLCLSKIKRKKRLNYENI